MERVHEQVLELLRCGLWGGTPSAELFMGDVEWQKILTVARQQAVLGVVYTQIELLEGVQKPSKETMMQLYKLTTLNRRLHLKHIQVAGIITQRLKEAGIDQPVLLKGVGVSMNYIDAGARQCGDIDIYVGPNHYKRSLEVAKGWSESRFEDDPISLKHYHFLFDGVHIEIHRIAISESNVTSHHSQFQSWCRSELEGDNIRRELIEGVELYLPPYTFDAIYIFYHAWSHLCTQGVGFRQVSDWCCFLSANSSKIDRQEVAAKLHYFGLQRSWGCFSAVATRLLALSEDAAIAYDSAEQWHTDGVVERIWSGGNFGFYNPKRAGAGVNSVVRKFINFSALYAVFRFLYSIDRRYSYNFLFRTPMMLVKNNLFQIYCRVTKRVV